MSQPTAPAELARLESVIDDTLRLALAEIDAVQAVERVKAERPFWYVRIAGEAKQHYSAEFTLGQRTLVVESYFMPDPEEQREQVFEHLLVRNRSMHPLQFVIGSGPQSDGATGVYLRGQVDNVHVDADSIDRLLAAVYEYTEQFFVPAMRIGFASRFNR